MTKRQKSLHYAVKPWHHLRLAMKTRENRIKNIHTYVCFAKDELYKHFLHTIHLALKPFVTER